jgi:hypothetical protein
MAATTASYAPWLTAYAQLSVVTCECLQLAQAASQRRRRKRRAAQPRHRGVDGGGVHACARRPARTRAVHTTEFCLARASFRPPQRGGVDAALVRCARGAMRVIRAACAPEAAAASGASIEAEQCRRKPGGRCVRTRSCFTAWRSWALGGGALRSESHTDTRARLSAAAAAPRGSCASARLTAAGTEAARVCKQR